MAIGAATLAALWLAMMFTGSGLLDQRIYEALYAGGHPALITAAKVASLFGDPRFLVPATLAIGAWLWWRNHPRTALTWVAVAMLGRGVNSLVKLDVGRVRPELRPHLMVENTNSFPSGHATGSMIFFLTLALLIAHRGPYHRSWAAAAVVVSLLVGTSRVMLGVHWPSDVVGGWAFGVLWVVLCLRMTEDLVARDSERRVRR